MPLPIDRQLHLNAVAALVLEANAMPLPALPPRPKAATLPEWEAWEAEQAEHDAALALRKPIYAEASLLALQANLPERVYLKAEANGEAYAVRLATRRQPDGSEALRIRVDPWRDPAADSDDGDSI